METTILSDYSHILWFLITPSHVIGWGFLVGLAVYWHFRKSAQFIIMSSAALFLCLGFLPMGYNLVHYWETQHTKPLTLPDSIDGIIVLGGSTDKELSDAHQTYILNDSADRLSQFAALALQHPRAKFIFSGGIKSEKLENTEAYYARSFFSSIGLPMDNIIFEEQSRNTYENALLSKKLVSPAPEESWLLVTSAFHMPRSVAVFKALEWNVIPYPVDYKTGKTYRFLPLDINIPRNLKFFDIGTKEALGQLAYKITGKT